MLDPTDLRMLTALQRDAQLTAHQLGEILHLSPSQAGRRRQRLEASGIIEGYRARLSAPKLGLAVQAFVQVQMATHAPDKVKTFTRILETRVQPGFQRPKRCDLGRDDPSSGIEKTAAAVFQ